MNLFIQIFINKRKEESRILFSQYEDVFRHEVLDTTVLDYFITLKNNLNECEGVVNPCICSVFPADETPCENFDIKPDKEISWISNTDPSHRHGQHWVSLLRNVECVNLTLSYGDGDETEICHNVTYYVADSWGFDNVIETCKVIISTLESNYAIANFNHSSRLLMINRRCRCKFEINFTVLKIIQHEMFENCSWYALRFCTMDKELLMHWANSDLNDHGQMKSNYIELTTYFKENFFPKIITSPCLDYTNYKIKILKQLRPCKLNQACCNHKFYKTCCQ